MKSEALQLFSLSTEILSSSTIYIMICCILELQEQIGPANDGFLHPYECDFNLLTQPNFTFACHSGLYWCVKDMQIYTLAKFKRQNETIAIVDEKETNTKHLVSLCFASHILLEKQRYKALLVWCRESRWMTVLTLRLDTSCGHRLDHHLHGACSTIMYGEYEWSKCAFKGDDRMSQSC